MASDEARFPWQGGTSRASRVSLCPECGWPLLTGYRPASLDPDDAEPSAVCTRPSCDYAY